MGQISLDGTITSGPPTSVPPGATPAATDTIPLSTLATPKGWNVVTGPNSRNVASSFGTFSTLSGLGAADSVTQGTFLYLRASAPLQLRMTQANLAGGADIVSVHQVTGPLVQEFPDAGYLKLLEVSGTATVEWLVSGNV